MVTDNAGNLIFTSQPDDEVDFVRAVADRYGLSTRSIATAAEAPRALVSDLMAGRADKLQRDKYGYALSRKNYARLLGFCSALELTHGFRRRDGGRLLPQAVRVGLDTYSLPPDLLTQG